MHLPFLRACTLIVMSMALAACEQATTDVSAAGSENGPHAGNASKAVPETADARQSDTAAALELKWDDLIPADSRLDKVMEQYDLSTLEDDDPRAEQALAELQAFWKEAPVVNDHDGKLVKLPGFVVPLDMDADTVREFLLVPYFGACIHAPPPPANQTVYVITDENNPYKGGMFDTVWVTGEMAVEKIDSQHGTAGYRIQAMTVDPYE